MIREIRIIPDAVWAKLVNYLSGGGFKPGEFVLAAVPYSGAGAEPTPSIGSIGRLFVCEPGGVTAKWAGAPGSVAVVSIKV
jgi:hypothetical protein